MIPKNIVQEYLIFSQKKQRVVIVSDSLSMPRPDEQPIALLYEETFPYLLRKELNNEYEIINRGRRSNTVSDQCIDQNIFDDILLLYPKFVVVHLGICDCAPRLFSKRFGKYIIGNIRPTFLRIYIISLFSRHRLFLTKHFLIQDVSIKKFAYLYDYLISTIIEFGSIPIIVNISRTSSKNESRSFKFKEHIENYNKVILETANRYKTIHIDMHVVSGNNEILLPDGIHYNHLGSNIVANKIASEIINYK